MKKLGLCVLIASIMTSVVAISAAAEKYWPNS